MRSASSSTTRRCATAARREDIAFTLEDKLRIAERLDDFGVALHRGRLAGLEPARRGVLRAPSSGSALQAREDRRLRLDAARRRHGSERPQPARCCSRARDAGGHHRRQDLGPARARRSAHPAGGEPRGHPRLGRLPRKRRVDEVIFDAEHFFDGCRGDPDYALECIARRRRGRRRRSSACATRAAARLPAQVAAGGRRARARRSRRPARHPLPQRLRAGGRELAGRASSTAASRCRARSTASASAAATPTCARSIANLQLKLGLALRRAAAQLAEARRRCRTSSTSWPTCEPNKRQAYVGQSAFAHKGGLHVAAVQKNAATYEHIDPELVGNRQRVLVSDLSGRSQPRSTRRRVRHRRRRRRARRCRRCSTS